MPEGYVPIYWTGGNHEDWDALDSLGRGITEVDPGIFYCSFGSTLEVSPNLTILFAGGAESHDKEWRLKEMAKGASKIWWEQEGVSESDMKMLDIVLKANWVISHTAPYTFDVRMDGLFLEPSRAMLDRVFDKYHPKKWFFGHFHKHMKGHETGCEWECLADMRGQGKRWDKVWLEWED